jgi:hypothetical protein
VLGASDRSCRLTELDPRSGVLGAERTKTNETGTDPTGERDRSAQRRQYSKSPRPLHPRPSQASSHFGIIP